MILNDKFIKFIGFNTINLSQISINSYDIAKFLAIFLMVIDHLGYFFFTEYPLLRGVGRAAFPLFFFLIGYNFKDKLYYNLFVIGSIITVYRYLLTDFTTLDILISAFITQYFLKLIIKKNYLTKNNLYVILLAVAIWQIPSQFVFMYGFTCLLFAVAGYTLKNQAQLNVSKQTINIFIISSLLINYFSQVFFFGYKGDDLAIFACSFFLSSAILFAYFTSFKIYDVQIESKKLRNSILFMARNSMFIYWFHLVLFIYVSVLLLPELYID
jgi:hypothetical protein